MTDPLSKEKRSALMARVRTKNTAPEQALRKALWTAGLRGWRCHPKTVPGRPDIAWIGRRVAVFVDGAFWHGHPDVYWGQSGKFWNDKIERNRLRDRAVDNELTELGWIVVRIWDFELAEDVEASIRRVLRGLQEEGRRSGRRSQRRADAR